MSLGQADRYKFWTPDTFRRTADSLLRIADKWNGITAELDQKAHQDTNLSRRALIIKQGYRAADSSHHYIMLAEQEMCRALRDARGMEGFRLWMLKLKGEPVDSSLYKQVDEALWEMTSALIQEMNNWPN